MMKPDDGVPDEAASEMLALVKPHLQKVLEDGLNPYHIRFPDQTAGNKNCRICGEESRLVKLGFFGAAVGRAYPFCVAMVCLDCMASPEKREEFMNRIRARYRETTAQPNQG